MRACWLLKEQFDILENKHICLDLDLEKKISTALYNKYEESKSISFEYEFAYDLNVSVCQSHVVIYTVHINVRPCELKDASNAQLKGPALLSMTSQHQVSSSSHHPSAPCVDIVFHVTQAVVRRDNPRQPAVQGQVRWLVGHQEQQTLGLWSPTHRSLKKGRRGIRTSCDACKSCCFSVLTQSWLHRLELHHTRDKWQHVYCC